MRKTTAKVLAGAFTIVFALSACTNNDTPINPSPTETPVPSVSETTLNTDPTTAPPKATDEPTQEQTTKPEESASSPASEAAAPPATQFAQRWGARYPDVPEYAILKAANASCAVITELGNGWETNPLAQMTFKKAVEAAGLSGNDGLEFAQDANQNYCSTVANPT